MTTLVWVHTRVLPLVGRPVTMAVGGKVCSTCHGRGGWDKDQARWEPCTRCGGKGGRKTGKLLVPCSGCNGAGGRHRNVVTFVHCNACNGKGLR